jgi:pimeloyl-ACP methyl ester carboxylesterase
VFALPIRLLRFLTLAMFVMSTLPARAQQPVIQSSDFHVVTGDGVSIHVHRKVGAAPKKVPVLLIHGTWGDGRTWDFPDRSVMDYLAVRGYDVYALDLRGMGSSDHPVSPANYFTIDILNRVNDAAAVATYIVASAGRAPVVMGWSQGGVITGLLAASAPQLVAGVGFFSVPQDGFFVPPPFVPLLQSIQASGVDSFLPTPDQIYAIAFGFDPITGKPTISADAFLTFFSLSEPDSVRAVGEEISPLFFDATLVPAWPTIHVPALVVDGALDVLVGTDRAQALFSALGSTNKQLVYFPAQFARLVLGGQSRGKPASRRQIFVAVLRLGVLPDLLMRGLLVVQ